jgi:hypothetical protein
MINPVRKCSVKNCVNKTFKSDKLCPTHLHRRKKGIDFAKPIRYLNHGESSSSTYKSWAMMKNRCLNEKTPDYRHYGGRGIKLKKAWQDYRIFKKEMGEKPTPLHTIGRINNEKGYCKTNCKWETRKEQAQNRRPSLKNRGQNAK